MYAAKKINGRIFDGGEEDNAANGIYTSNPKYRMFADMTPAQIAKYEAKVEAKRQWIIANWK